MTDLERVVAGVGTLRLAFFVLALRLVWNVPVEVPEICELFSLVEQIESPSFLFFFFFFCSCLLSPEMLSFAEILVPRRRLVSIVEPDCNDISSSSTFFKLPIVSSDLPIDSPSFFQLLGIFEDEDDRKVMLVPDKSSRLDAFLRPEEVLLECDALLPLFFGVIEGRFKLRADLPLSELRLLFEDLLRGPGVRGDVACTIVDGTAVYLSPPPRVDGPPV